VFLNDLAHDVALGEVFLLSFVIDEIFFVVFGIIFSGVCGPGRHFRVCGAHRFLLGVLKTIQWPSHIHVILFHGGFGVMGRCEVIVL
jgi:hypothetical protein